MVSLYCEGAIQLVAPFLFLRTAASRRRTYGAARLRPAAGASSCAAHWRTSDAKWHQAFENFVSAEVNSKNWPGFDSKNWLGFDSKNWLELDSKNWLGFDSKNWLGFNSKIDSFSI
jgi:hypothetical protein